MIYISLTIITLTDIIVVSVDDITEVDMANQQTQALTEAVFYILLSLKEPLHGYGIMQNVEMMSNGRVKLAAGTLYEIGRASCRERVCQYV